MAYTAKLWVIPDKPGSVGDSIVVQCDDAMVDRIKAATSWFSTIALFKNDVPAKYHIVQIDLKCVMELREATRTLRFED